MNLAIRGVEANLGAQWADSFHADQHRGLKADFVLAKPSELARALEALVPERNDFAHGVTPAEEAIADDEAPLHALWKRLTTALAPLGECELVSQVDLNDFDSAQDRVSYKVRLHQGASDRFRVADRWVRGRLEADWCYLLQPAAHPLALSPLVLCRYDDQAGLHQLYLARAFTLEPGGKVEAMAVTSAAKIKVQAP